MRNFRFRLDPVMRLKEYTIQRVEEEIARIEGKIQNLVHEIEAGKIAVQQFRQRLIDDVDDEHLLQATRELDLFAQFTAREEIRRFGEIANHRKEKEKKQKELMNLYQEKKVLERLRERRHTEWEIENQKEDNAIMDEIGTQKYIRRGNEFGGVILYLLVPIALVAAVAAVGIATGVIDKTMLEKMPFFGPAPQSATTTVQSATGPLEEEFITLEQLIGDPNTPMPVLLRNFSERIDQVRKKEQELAELQSQLDAKQVLFEELQSALAQQTKQASDYVLAYQDMKRQFEQSQKSELSKYEEDIATTLSSAKGKEIALIMTSLYNPPTETAEERRLKAEALVLRNAETQLKTQEKQMLETQQQTGTVDPVALAGIREEIRLNQDQYQINQTRLAEVQEKIRDSQLLLLKILHRFQPRGRKDLFVALGKSDPNTAALIIQDFMTTTNMEMYKITPTPTPFPSIDQTDEGTAPLGTE